MHAALLRIAQATEGTPFERQLWLVGGAVRDRLLGRPVPEDFDLVSERSSDELARLLYERGVASIPPVTYARFGTAMVRVEGVAVELATARRESYAPETRKPHVEPATLEEDAARRDFTVNALYQNLHTGEVRDLLGRSFEDLRNRVLRTPLDPVQTFDDDPLRMLRAVRFRAALEFDPAPGLYEAIQSERERLRIVSSERIRDEFIKMLRLPTAPDALEDLRTTGLLEIFAPELAALKGVEQGGYHHLDVWDHTMLALHLAGSGDLTLRLATLFHDIGKPACRSIDEKGATRFFQHESVGESITREVLGRLRFSQEQVDAVSKLVKNHMRLQTALSFSDSAARRLIRDLGEELDRLLRLVEADAGALRPGVKVIDIDAIRAKLATVRSATPAAVLKSPLSGREIMELTELPEGPEVGRIKAMLLEKVLEGEVAAGDKEGAKAILRHALSAPSVVAETTGNEGTG